MLRHHKLFHSTIALNLHPPIPPPQLSQNLAPPTPPQSLPIIKQSRKLSRRDLTIFGNSSLLLLLSSQIQDPSSNLSRAEEVEETLPITDENDKQQLEENSNSISTTVSCSNKTPTKNAFLDISIDGEPVGRIVVGLYENDAPAGVARFSSLVSGAAGLSYRRKEFIKIMPNFVQHGGVRSISADNELAKRTKGSNPVVEKLKDEWKREYENCPGNIKHSAGTVGIIVRNPSKPPPKLKLVARGGKLEIDEEEVGIDPNGTEFVIATKDSPELDASTLVVGRVMEGMEVVERIAQVKAVKENTSSPYFRAAKIIGDKRAVVAERGFNRPYSKVIITNCGLMP